MMFLQEGSAVSWEGEFYSPWVEYAWGFFWIGAIYGYWRLLQWYVRRRLECRDWRRTRFVVPTVLIPAGALLSWLSYLAAGEHEVFNMIAGFCAFVNAPALIGAGVVGIALTGHAPDWVLAAAACVAGWFSWWLAIILVEYRIESTTPVQLDLRGHTSRPTAL
jgi:hypothetical protein